MPIQSKFANDHESQKHWTTPQKAKLKAEAEILDQSLVYSPRGTRRTKRQLFKDQNVPRASGFQILKHSSIRRLVNDSNRKETRGRKSKLTESDVHHAEMIIWRYGREGRVLTWEELAQEADLDVSGRTLQRHLVTLGYRRCLACRRNFVGEEIAALRVKFAEEMLAKYPNPKDWYNVRFSDEVHLGFGPPGRIYVTRKPGESTCPDCIQQKNEPKREDEKKVNAWGACEYDFKSSLHFYDCGNNNGAMKMTTYIGILEQEVTTWPSWAVLEEDGCSGHGPGKNSIVTKWRSPRELLKRESFGLRSRDA